MEGSPGKASAARGGDGVETEGRNLGTKLRRGLLCWMFDERREKAVDPERRGDPGNCHHLGQFPCTLTCLYCRPAKKGVIPVRIA